MSFDAAEANFTAGARHGIEAALYWPGIGTVRADELVLRRMLPLAQEGLAAWGVDAEAADRYLSIIEQRCVHRSTGATWQVRAVADAERRGLDRGNAILEMMRAYLEGMEANVPVHEWPPA
jgi:hypothetical protein